ncbi:MAG TPA: methyl-accepting chemotaxis protein [Accumulibacter sp.]|jgi:methyl-accepting chemotaxis protein|nr:methyl-accepting chemotaxis protein [Accumulibacter sp.]HQC79552.1 methyl-accepting chemotaxis protein [Accumulibacter sp.]
MSLTIKLKLLLLVVFLIAIAAVDGLLGLHGMKNGVDGLETVYNDRVVPLRDLREVVDAYAVNIVDTNHKVRNGNLTPADGVKSIEAAEKVIREKWKDYLATSLNDDEKRVIGQIEPLMKRGDAATAKLKSLMSAGDTEGIANFSANELYPAIDPITNEFGKLIEIQLTVAKQVFDTNASQYAKLRLVVVVVLLVGSGLGVAVSWHLIVHSVVRPLTQASDAVEAISQGDLTRPLPAARADEVGAIIAKLARMQTGLRDLISGLRSSVEVVGSSANQLASSASASAKVSQSQSDAAAGMAAGIEELSVSIDQVDVHAREAKNVTVASGTMLDESGHIIHAAATGIRSIADAVNATAGSIQELEALSGQISSIVSVIREIADQTNLLALNAAIEAARAGEQGRGFAVVADEVRKLAERTTSSTLEIASMIDKIQQGARRAVTEMESGVVKVNQGVDLAQKAGDSVGSIRTASEQVTHVVDDIGQAIREQAAAARDIAKRVEHIAQAAEENSATVAQTAASAHNLESLARDLDRMASRFKV